MPVGPEPIANLREWHSMVATVQRLLLTHDAVTRIVISYLGTYITKQLIYFSNRIILDLSDHSGILYPCYHSSCAAAVMFFWIELFPS